MTRLRQVRHSLAQRGPPEGGMVWPEPGHLLAKRASPLSCRSRRGYLGTRMLGIVCGLFVFYILQLNRNIAYFIQSQILSDTPTPVCQ